MTDSQTALDPETAVTVGRILAPHGILGEIKVQPLTDFAERFKPGARLWLDGAPVRVKTSRWIARLVYVKLDGIDDRDAVDALRDHLLQVPDLHRLDAAGVFYHHDIVGLRVETAEGELLGKVDSIIETGANDVYVVQGEQGELLLPAISDVVREIDLAHGRVVVELMPGLEFVKPVSRTRPRRPQRPPQNGAAGYATGPVLEDASDAGGTPEDDGRSRA